MNDIHTCTYQSITASHFFTFAKEDCSHRQIARLPLHLGMLQYSFSMFSFVVKHHGWASTDDITEGLRQ